MVLGTLFDKKMDKVRLVDGKSAIWTGSGLAVFFFVIYASYGLGMSQVTIPPTFILMVVKHFPSAPLSSTKVMVRPPTTPRAINAYLPHLADAGQVVNVFMSILIGSFSLALLAPEAQGEFIVCRSNLASFSRANSHHQWSWRSCKTVRYYRTCARNRLCQSRRSQTRYCLW